MNTECLRIADQLRRAFSGDSWHGPAIDKILSGVTAEQARARPIRKAHTIWELVLHIEIYVDVARKAIEGVPMPKLYGTEADWKTVVTGDESWPAAMSSMFNSASQLELAIEGMNDKDLISIAPGRTYDFYHLLHGVVQHSLYHAGQLVLLKNALD